MRNFVNQQASRLLDRLAFQCSRAAKTADAEAVHDFRISIRRFTQCLRVFEDFFPGRPLRKTRKRLKRVMDLSAEVRNRDIAIGLLEKSGVDGTRPMLKRLGEERKLARKELISEIRRLVDRNAAHKWRDRLELDRG